MVQQPELSDLVTLIQRLDRAEIDWDAENLADCLWLSRYMEGTTIATPQPRQRSSEQAAIAPPAMQHVDADETPAPPPDLGLYPPPLATSQPNTPQPAVSKGIPFQTPTAPALRKTLEIGRALRPLMRKVDSYTRMVLDEAATAEQTAEQQFCVTVVKPAQERWLEVALVIEESASSFLWQETLRDFKQVLERQGAFRSLVVWYLQTSPQGAVTLFAKRPTENTPQQPRSPKELIDPSGRRLILFASDCISPAWRSDSLYEHYLQPWSQHCPLAIVQMLPSHLWRRTVLSAALDTHFSAWTPGQPNHKLPFRAPPIGVESDAQKGLKLPVITLDPTSLAPWGRMVAGFGDGWATGVWFDEGWQSLSPPNPVTPAPALTAAQLVQRFDTTASVMAQRLARLMALVPLSLPIIYLLQETMLRDSTPLHLAEVFMSGLVQREEDALPVSEAQRPPSANKLYEFVPGVRELLSTSVAAATAETVLDRVSQYIGKRLGKSIYSFTALLMLEQELGALGGTELLQFARITRQTLQRMGGGYAALVEAIDQPIPPIPPVPYPFDPFAAYPPLAVLEFTTAQLVDRQFPVLQTQIVDVVTIVLDYETAATETVLDLQLFEFEVATLEQHREWAIHKQRQHRIGLLVEPLTARVELEMVLLPGGTFVMGSPEAEPERSDAESPQHTVSLESFLMGRYPVTQAQWRAVAAMPQINRSLEPDPSRFKGANRPVEQVSWYEAVEFCDRLSAHTENPYIKKEYRLPTEAEWEYACRAGTTTPFHFGETISTDLANYDGDSTYANGPQGKARKETTFVDHFGIANAFGLCDLHGNAWEWCQDHWHNGYEGAPIDGSACLSENEKASRALRGGSWVHTPRHCRSAFRYYNPPDNRYNYVGFRVVCSAP